MNRETYLTPEGKVKLERELENLMQSRPELSRELQSICADGLSYEALDPAYETARNDLAMLESRITEIQDVLAHSWIISHAEIQDTVKVGSCVRLKIGPEEIEEYMVVGRAEANPREGKISNESPVGRAILGKKIGDEVTVRTPEGDIQIRILKP